ncbi:hypothetical protein [Flavobacterium davisii]|uniref:hypothetical protein n=1 Tax=Flavobacterium davisii TaxID=2906077 RepID=UPI0035D00C47
MKKKQLLQYSGKAIFWLLVISSVTLVAIYFHQQNLTKNGSFKSIVDGIISGVVTAFILFIVQILWKQNLLIWIENLLYQDVKIEGEWNGFIVPFIGLDELDKIQRKIAWERFKKMQKENSLNNKKHNYEEQSSQQVTTSTIYDEKTGKEETVEAEIILNNKDNNNNVNDNQNRTFISISAKPIIVRAELKRKGHQINGRIIEIGGASDIHTYDLNGSFKNLILTASYESTSKSHIDRGALSLMLVENGRLLEGFFSSYNDNEHCMSPMKCYLYKRSSRDKN